MQVEEGASKSNEVDGRGGRRQDTYVAKEKVEKGEEVGKRKKKRNSPRVSAGGPEVHVVPS